MQIYAILNLCNYKTKEEEKDIDDQADIKMQNYFGWFVGYVNPR